MDTNRVPYGISACEIGCRGERKYFWGSSCAVLGHARGDGLCLRYSSSNRCVYCSRGAQVERRKALMGARTLMSRIDEKREEARLAKELAYIDGLDDEHDAKGGQ